MTRRVPYSMPCACTTRVVDVSIRATQNRGSVVVLNSMWVGMWVKLKTETRLPPRAGELSETHRLLVD